MDTDFDIFSMEGYAIQQDVRYPLGAHFRIVMSCSYLFNGALCEHIQIIRRFFGSFQLAEDAGQGDVFRHALNIISALTGFTVGGDQISIVTHSAESEDETVIEVFACCVVATGRFKQQLPKTRLEVIGIVTIQSFLNQKGCGLWNDMLKARQNLLTPLPL